jgi:hypothetical protein
VWSFVFWLLNFDKIFIKKEKEKSAHFSLWVLACSQKCEGGLNVFTSYPVYSQIWLKFIMEDHHFGYRTKMKEKTLTSR